MLLLESGRGRNGSESREPRAPHSILALQPRALDPCPTLASVLMCYMYYCILAGQTPGRLLLTVSPLVTEVLSGLSESLVARRAERGQGKAYIQDELMHGALPMQGTGEQGQQPGFSLKAEGGGCVSHRDHALGAPYLLQDLWLPLIGHSNSEHKPILWEDAAKEVMSEHKGALCCLYPWAPSTLPAGDHRTHRDTPGARSLWFPSLHQSDLEDVGVCGGGAALQPMPLRQQFRQAQLEGSSDPLHSLGTLRPLPAALEVTNH